jgi:hypothetical protein
MSLVTPLSLRLLLLLTRLVLLLLLLHQVLLVLLPHLFLPLPPADSRAYPLRLGDQTRDVQRFEITEQPHASVQDRVGRHPLVPLLLSALRVLGRHLQHAELARGA